MTSIQLLNPDKQRQTNGRNDPIPIGANAQSEDDAEDEFIDAAIVLSEMESPGNRVNIVILDGCRDNPLVRSFRPRRIGLLMDIPTGPILR